jgi:hypothetical protein
MKSLFLAIFIIILVVVICAPILFLNAYTLEKIWLWFIVPTFHAPQIDLFGAIGVILIVNLLRGFTVLDDKLADKDEDNKKHLKNLLLAYSFPIVVLSIAWIIKFFLAG